MTEPAPNQTPVPPTAPAPPPTVSTLDPRRKSPLLAAVLSFMPGLGQVYVGYYQRGFVNILVVVSLIAILVSDVPDVVRPVAGVFLGFFWLYNHVDAWRRATLYNHALAGHGTIELPSELQAPGFRGSVAGGATLAIVGFILLLNTKFDVSLAWVEEWWPVAFIGFGGYLIWKALQEKAAEGPS